MTFIFYIMFFQYYDNHPDLHSFPTRRSSDLVAGVPAKVIGEAGCPEPARFMDQIFEDLVHETGRDRKSTRLNSSHLGISYAVFCLEKKKNTTQMDYAQRISLIDSSLNQTNLS